jgi:hypothetical protein
LHYICDKGHLKSSEKDAQIELMELISIPVETWELITLPIGFELPNDADNNVLRMLINTFSLYYHLLTFSHTFPITRAVQVYRHLSVQKEWGAYKLKPNCSSSYAAVEKFLYISLSVETNL